jgi:hypothetical protein
MGNSMKSLWWYVTPLRIKIEEELDTRPDLLNRLGYFKSRFIRWDGWQRVSYEADLDDEVKEFEDKFIKSRLYNTDIKLWGEIRIRIFKRDNYTCKYCKVVGGILEVDHIRPISKGGTNLDVNLTTSCRTCNRQKKDKYNDEPQNN